MLWIFFLSCLIVKNHKENGSSHFSVENSKAQRVSGHNKYMLTLELQFTYRALNLCALQLLLHVSPTLWPSILFYEVNWLNYIKLPFLWVKNGQIWTIKYGSANKNWTLSKSSILLRFIDNNVEKFHIVFILVKK